MSSYYFSEPSFRFVLEAVHLVAAYGERLLPAYRFDPTRVSGAIATRRFAPVRLGVSPTTRTDGSNHTAGPERVGEHLLGEYLSVADDADRGGRLGPEAADRTGDLDGLRWFDLPPACVSSTSFLAPIMTYGS